MSKKTEAFEEPPAYTAVAGQPTYPTQQPAYQNESSVVVGCQLISLEGLHDPVDLLDAKPVIIGRQKQFKIKDASCSKEQVQITADYSGRSALVKRLGSKPSKIDSVVVDKNAELKLNEGQTLYLVFDKLPYKVEFTYDKAARGPKRKMENKESNRKAKKLKTEDNSEQEATNDSDDDVEEKLKRMRENLSKVDRKMEETVVRKKVEAVKLPKGGLVQDTKSGWSEHDDSLMIYRPEGQKPSSKIASFDIDGTIITTKSGRVFATGPSDWQILYAEIPKKLKDLQNQGYKIVFFTNQLGISKGKLSKGDFQKKVEAILKVLGCSVHVQAGIKTGYYRKPAMGSWEHFIDSQNGGVAVDMAESFYCGDAAGRPENKEKKKKKDFSCSDRLFSLNAGLKFYTPEELFLGQKPGPYNLPEFNPKTQVEKPVKLKIDDLVGKGQEMVINCGFPASGKSHFSKKVLVPKGYVHVSRDDLGTWQKCAAKSEEALKSGKSVVVDNTNPDTESRARFIDVAKSAGVPCRCFYFPATMDQCRHNEAFRELTDDKHAKINSMVMNSIKKKFKAPEKKEGFADVVEIPFVPFFKNKDEENLYKLFLVEK